MRDPIRPRSHRDPSLRFVVAAITGLAALAALAVVTALAGLVVPAAAAATPPATAAVPAAIPAGGAAAGGSSESAAVAGGFAPVPRPATALAYRTVADQSRQVGGDGAKGDVTVVVFLLTRCPHCWRVAQTVAKVEHDLAPRGLKVLAVALDNNIDGARVAEFSSRAGVSFPVGYAGSPEADAFLGRQGSTRFQVPQVVVIDRAGNIRAQSRPTGEVNLEKETYLRSFLGDLLKEGSAVTAK